MSTPLIGQDIINRFHLYTGDQSELSTTDELNLLNKVYDDALNQRPWLFLRKVATGTIQSAVDTNGNQYGWATLPTDFRFFAENNQKTDISQTINNNAAAKVVFTGPTYNPVQIVNFADRRQFYNTSGFAYADPIQNKLIFTWLPSDSTYEFDYTGNWNAITLVTSPIFSADFHDMIFQYMAVDSVIINLFDRAHSYANENKAAADDMLAKLKLLDANQYLN